MTSATVATEDFSQPQRLGTMAYYWYLKVLSVGLLIRTFGFGQLHLCYYYLVLLCYKKSAHSIHHGPTGLIRLLGIHLS